MRQKHFIDSHKLATGIFILLLMAAYHQWDNPTAWIYLALHGTYGILWAVKSRIFPDASWEQPTGWLYGALIWGGLSLYWVAPWLIMARAVQAPAWYLGMCVSLNIFGVFFHFSADMQKHITLKLQPDQLISSGLMAKVRNINYFGELLIYGSFGLFAMHWLPILILMAWVVLVWLPNMRKKDRSLGKYPQFAEYQKRSRLFIPFLY